MFGSRRCEQLHAQTQSEEQLSFLPNLFFQHIEPSTRPKVTHSIAKCANAWQHNSLAGSQFLWMMRDLGWTSERFEGVHYRT
jgi:hypothetical protein